MQVQQPPQTPDHTNRKKLSSRTRLALLLIIGPTVAIALTIGLFVFMQGDWSTITQLTQDYQVLAASIALAWLADLIAGIVLLARRPKDEP